MVYNNAAFMGIPWETLIKMYRSSLGKEPRPTVEVYLEEFLAFITQERFVTADQEIKNLWQMVDDLFRRVLHGVEEQSKNAKALKTEIREFGNRFRESGRTQSMTEDHIKEFLSTHRSELNERIEDAFSEFGLTPQLKRSISNLVRDLLRSDIRTPNHSGLVIAGFGEEEIFPTLVAVTIEGTLGGTLKYDRRFEVDISRDGQAATIVPFAQREMVERFMEGVDPMFLDYVGDTMGEVSTQLVVEVLRAFNIECTEEQEEVVREAAFQQATEYLKEAAKFKEREFVTPIMEIVQHLPKEELAEMAEALVSLTALKRRVSLEEETVGGPIDVAVISKGDGLIWIRRKH